MIFPAAHNILFLFSFNLNIIKRADKNQIRKLFKASKRISHSSSPKFMSDVVDFAFDFATYNIFRTPSLVNSSNFEF